MGLSHCGNLFSSLSCAAVFRPKPGLVKSLNCPIRVKHGLCGPPTAVQAVSRRLLVSVPNLGAELSVIGQFAFGVLMAKMLDEKVALWSVASWECPTMYLNRYIQLFMIF